MKAKSFLTNLVISVGYACFCRNYGWYSSMRHRLQLYSERWNQVDIYQWFWLNSLAATFIQASRAGIQIEPLGFEILSIYVGAIDNQSRNIKRIRSINDIIKWHKVINENLCESALLIYINLQWLIKCTKLTNQTFYLELIL